MRVAFEQLLASPPVRGKAAQGIRPARDRQEFKGGGAPDPVTGHVLLGQAQGLGADQPNTRVLASASDLSRLAHQGDKAPAALDRLLVLVARFPSCERLQVLAARVIEIADKEADARAVWAGVQQRFPMSVEALRLLLRWTARDQGREAALRLMEERFPERPSSAGELLAYAWGWDELKIFARADAAFEALLASDERDCAAAIAFSKSLLNRGEVWRAFSVLDGARKSRGTSPKLAKALAPVEAKLQQLRALSPRFREGRASDAILSGIFEDLGRQPVPRPERRSFVGSVLMIIGSLGAGGAERQFAVTAGALQRAIHSGEATAGYDVIGPLNIFCRSLRSREAADFFEGSLRSQNIPVYEYADFEAFGGNEGQSVVAPIREALHFLPQQIIDGTTRLADSIRYLAPDVVHIWQDGSILAAGLAAAIARVPRIVLTVRSLPPIDRPDRYRPEYEVVFRSLLALPSVRLVANSNTAARRYEEWLELEQGSVDVIYNGVDALDDVARPEDLAKSSAFDAATAGWCFTVGSVMRLDENKRPFLWLDAAAAMLRSQPAMRFILVGDGPLKAAAIDYASQLGIAHRVLFTGRSQSVGYWLSRMDAFALLSAVEGLPNVLIEAQHAGVPVITTPAGGAAETVLAGETGFVLPLRDGEPDPQDVADLVLALHADPRRRAAMCARARDWAHATFSVSVMTERMVKTFIA